MKTATVLQHLAFEDLGLLAPTLEARGYHIDCHEVGRDGLTGLDPAQADLMVVLGGPVGTYETDDYPWLVTERALIARRLASKRPLLGICLGMQMACIEGARNTAGIKAASSTEFGPADEPVVGLMTEWTQGNQRVLR